jgi:hypothetical protein
MARRGRPRKTGKRTASGRLKDRPYLTNERVGPTPELARHKKAVDGKEPEDPLSHLGFELGCIQALDLFRRQKRACGFSCGSLVANHDDVARLAPDAEMAEADAMVRRAKYEAAAGALVMHARDGYHAVQSFCGHWGTPWQGDENRLRAGALALAEHYYIKVEATEVRA